MAEAGAQQKYRLVLRGERGGAQDARVDIVMKGNKFSIQRADARQLVSDIMIGPLLDSLTSISMEFEEVTCVDAATTTASDYQPVVPRQVTTRIMPLQEQMAPGITRKRKVVTYMDEGPAKSAHLLPTSSAHADARMRESPRETMQHSMAVQGLCTAPESMLTSHGAGETPGPGGASQSSHDRPTAVGEGVPAPVLPSTPPRYTRIMHVEETHIFPPKKKKCSNLKGSANRRPRNSSMSVSFDPLALLLDASFEGELELVMRMARLVDDPSQANEIGMTALDYAILGGNVDVVQFLVEFGCDINCQDGDGWMPLHWAASCNELTIVQLLVAHGAAVLAETQSGGQTAADLCDYEEEGYEACTQYLKWLQEGMGNPRRSVAEPIVYAVFNFDACRSDELSVRSGDRLQVVRRGDDMEENWWWCYAEGKEGYVPRDILALYPCVTHIRRPAATGTSHGRGNNGSYRLRLERNTGTSSLDNP